MTAFRRMHVLLTKDGAKARSLSNTVSQKGIVAANVLLPLVLVEFFLLQNLLSELVLNLGVLGDENMRP